MANRAISPDGRRIVVDGADLIKDASGIATAAATAAEDARDETLAAAATLADQIASIDTVNLGDNRTTHGRTMIDMPRRFGSGPFNSVPLTALDTDSAAALSALGLISGVSRGDGAQSVIVGDNLDDPIRGGRMLVRLYVYSSTGVFPATHIAYLRRPDGGGPSQNMAVEQQVTPNLRSYTATLTLPTTNDIAYCWAGPTVGVPGAQISTWGMQLSYGARQAVGIWPSHYPTEIVESGALTLIHTSGERLKRYRADIAHLARAGARAITHHLWLDGDSWTERPLIPQALVADLIAAGVPIVGSGWLSIGGAGLTDGTTPSNLALNGATITDIQEQGGAASGLYSPDGFRAVLPDGAAGASATAVFKGRYLTIYYRSNAAQWRYTVDGGSPVGRPLSNTGLATSLVIDCGSEGWHTVVVSRGTPTGDVELYGMYAGSALPGLIVSKAGNAGAQMVHLAAARATSASAFILADILTQTPRFTVRMCYLTNESRIGKPVDEAVTSFKALVAAYRAASGQAEGYFAVPLRNGVAGISGGSVDIGEYLPDLAAACDAARFDLYSHYALSPRAAAVPHLWDEAQLHLQPGTGAAEMLVTAERRAFWETR